MVPSSEFQGRQWETPPFASSSASLCFPSPITAFSPQRERRVPPAAPREVPRTPLTAFTLHLPPPSRPPPPCCLRPRRRSRPAPTASALGVRRWTAVSSVLVRCAEAPPSGVENRLVVSQRGRKDSQGHDVILSLMIVMLLTY